ncbi:hypothetical protein E0H39_29645 [Rhizobium leguminosarum bv. viciae]|uniref:peptidase G2 autoproteolytic cleavage domain-containing protein n=1 Tax=Rhizobium leguminosarum TaxID=384 RepID=UPI00103E9177|nr:peptidase G2 autoproteolytic cleavage domain-containing protein [Rhizobium leguminosarum]TBY57982.1 hypothetical protein E0H39_29645 [Rhizobium leguminosarum bv. viciae]
MMVPNLTSSGSGSTVPVPGPRGYSAYQVAQQEGFAGTAAEWIASLKGVDGKAVELRKTEEALEWRQLPDGDWAVLVFLSEITGQPGKSVSLRVAGASIQWMQDGGAWADLVPYSALTGAPGLSVELQKTATHVQWRQTGGPWVNLIALSDLAGNGSSYDDSALVERISDVETDLAANYPRYNFEKSITAHYVYAGRISDDGNGNYVPNGGGIVIGGPTGVRYRQEGFYQHFDEGSIASYPNVANRANRLALCPSGNPQDVVGEDTASLALQHLNGSYEQRFVLVSKKAGEYRIASVATGVGVNFPITVAPGAYRVQRWEVNGTTTFTSEPLDGGANQNTVVSIKNPAVTQFMRLFGRTNGEFGIEYNSSAGLLDYRFNQIGLGIGGVNATRRVHVQVADQAVGSFFTSCTHASYSGLAMQIDVNRAASASYSYFFARSNADVTPDIEFNLRGDGQAFADLTWNANGADYAELFHWRDGNPEAQDRVGLSVVLVGDTIQPAAAGEEPIGVVSALPSVLGNSAWNSSQGKYLKDDFGRAMKDAVGNPILNPDFDPELTYTPREDRPEWSPVGLTGRLRLYKGQPTGSRWIKLADISADVEEWLVR